ncbi:MFS transporter [Enterococcus crotali]|uniref:MFS transporter n=1 Tax=Enterococcus crotali TaxID=1453587 RepID=UPI00047230FF|nr:MFS transporter [Enterococcus crotali]
MIRNRNFNILLIGRLIANFGDSLYAIATALLVYELSQSTFYSGFALFLTSSTGIVQILIGPFLDRMNIKRGLVLSQFIQSILLLLIPYFYYSDSLTLGKVLVLMPTITLINQFIYPSQLSLLPKILKEEDMLKGNTLFTLAYQGSDAIYNAIAGTLIASVGLYTVYSLSSITFFINSIIFMFLTHTIALSKVQKQLDISEPIKQYKSDIISSFGILKNKFLFSILSGFILMNFFTTGIYANLPAFSNSELQYSFYMAASGLGIIFGSILLNAESVKKISVKKIYVCSAFITGLSWTITTLLDHFTNTPTMLPVLFFFIGWIPIGMINILSQTIAQSIIPKEKVGAVMATIIGVSTCMSPFGALLGGLVGDVTNPAVTISISSLLIICIGIYWICSNGIKGHLRLKNISEERIVFNDYSY